MFLKNNNSLHFLLKLTNKNVFQFFWVLKYYQKQDKSSLSARFQKQLKLETVWLVTYDVLLYNVTYKNDRLPPVFIIMGAFD